MYGNFNGHEIHMMDDEERREYDRVRRENSPEGKAKARIEELERRLSREREERELHEEYRRADEYGEYSEDSY